MDARAAAALVMSAVAGLSTGIGGLIVVVFRRQSARFLTFSLAFSAGIMMTISLYEMLPESNRLFSETVGGRSIFYTALYLLVGLALANLADACLPEKAVRPQPGRFGQGRLFGVGLVTAVGIVIHNFPEGMATFMTGYLDVSLGLSLMAAISLHNIPEGISIAIPIYYATGSRRRALRYAFFSGMAEPAGALLAFLCLQRFLTQFGLGLFYAAIAGIMLYISLGELLPASQEYGHAHLSLYGALTGIVVMVVGLGLA